MKGSYIYTNIRNDRTKHVEIPHAIENNGHFCCFQVFLIYNTVSVKDYSNEGLHRYSLAVPNNTMKAGRCHVDVKGEYEEIEHREGYKSSQKKLPPVIISIWTLYTTEVV